MSTNRFGWLLGALGMVVITSMAQVPSPPALEAPSRFPHAPGPVSFSPPPIQASAFGASRQVNVDWLGNNIPGDAANEPSLCIDPKDPRRIAIGWRQFDNVTSDFRQAGWGYSTNGGTTWIFPGLIETNVFRSDPVLASDADGSFYYLSLQITPVFHCDLRKSRDGGASWQLLGPAVGGDKAWMTIDTTSGIGRGNIYQAWSLSENTYGNRTFSRSSDGGLTWSDPIALPQRPYWNTLDLGPNGELYIFGWNGSAFWLNRSTNAPDRNATLEFDLLRPVNLGGTLLFASTPINPVGLIGQPWVAVDRSSGPGRGNVYALSSVSGTGNPVNIMFSRSTDGGQTWSAPLRINDDAADQNAWHWFGTMSVAPNGRIDVCWNDTRSNPDNTLSELYYSNSRDGGLTWSRNRAVSPPFNHSLGYPVQRKMGDYIGMISLEDAACIAYAATFNGEQDVFFLRVEQPVITAVWKTGDIVGLSWKAVAGMNYCVQYKDNLSRPWSSDVTVGCVLAEGALATLEDKSTASVAQRFYRVVEQP